MFSSSGSPRFGFSRSSSRLSIQDYLEDGDFSCPFAFTVDDVDTTDSQTRYSLLYFFPTSLSESLIFLLHWTKLTQIGHSFRMNSDFGLVLVFLLQSRGLPHAMLALH